MGVKGRRALWLVGDQLERLQLHVAGEGTGARGFRFLPQRWDGESGILCCATEMWDVLLRVCTKAAPSRAMGSVRVALVSSRNPASNEPMATWVGF